MMTNETLKTQGENLKERGKELIEQGKQRQVIFSKKDGSTLFQTNLTIMAVIALVVLFSGISIPLVVIGAGIAMLMGIRVEVRNTAV